ncbi:MAG: hypothetical protein ACM3TR_09790 [Caulobacteraceae bacterium]
MKKLLFILILFLSTFIAFGGYYIHDRYFYSGELIGIQGTNIYHRDNCQFVKKTSIDKLVFFRALYNTALLNYRPCKTCHPPDNLNEIKYVIKEKEQELQKALEDIKTASDEKPFGNKVVIGNLSVRESKQMEINKLRNEIQNLKNRLN